MTTAIGKDTLEREAQSLKSIIGGEVTEETILERLIKYTHTHRMGLESSKRAVLREFGVVVEKNSDKTCKKVSISELREGDSPVTVIAKVQEIIKKTTKVNNVQTPINELIIEDETGFITLTVWEEELDIECGKIYRFNRCRVSAYKGDLNLSLSSSDNIVEVEDVTFEKSPRDKYIENACKLSDIKAGMTNVTIVCTVEYYYDRIVNTRNGPMMIYKGIVSDSNGKMEISSWKDIKVEQNKKYCFTKVKVDEYNGSLSLKVDGSCMVFEVE